MKRSFFFYCIVLFVVTTFFGNKAHAVKDPTNNRMVELVQCINSDGQIMGTATLCPAGSGNCTSTPCFTSPYLN